MRHTCCISVPVIYAHSIIHIALFSQQLTECFGLMDADGSGSIDVDELGAAFKLLGRRLQSQSDTVMSNLDFPAYSQFTYQALAKELHRALSLIDILISGIQMKQWEIAEIVAEVDTQGIGELGIAEFLQIMTHTMHRLATEENGTRQPTVRRS